MKCTHNFLVKAVILLLIIGMAFPLLAQRTSNTRPSSQQQGPNLSPQQQAQAKQAQVEMLAYIMKAILHTQDPKSYPIARGELSARFVPIIKNMPVTRRAKVQNKAFNAYKDPKLRRKLFGNYASRLDLRKNLKPQFGSKALLNNPSAKSKKPVVPKMANPYQDPYNDSECSLPDGSLRLMLKSIFMLEETDGAFYSNAGKDEIYMGAVLVGDDGDEVSVDPFYVKAFDGPVNASSSKKIYNPHKELQRWITLSDGTEKKYAATFFMMEEDGPEGYKEFKQVLDIAVKVFDDLTLGILGYIAEFIDGVATFFVANDYLNPRNVYFTIEQNAEAMVDHESLKLKGHGGEYQINFKWDYRKPKPELINIAKCYAGDDGTIYYFRPDGQGAFVAFGEHPNGSGSTILRGSMTPKGKMVGQWASVPKGKLKSSGLVSIEADPFCAGNILSVTGSTGDFPTHKLTAMPYPTNALGKLPEGYKGDFNNLTGIWKGSDKATYYLHQYPNGSVYLFGEKDFQSGAPAYAHIGMGKIEGKELKLEIRGLGKGQKPTNGQITFHINPYSLVQKYANLTMPSKSLSRTPPKMRPSYVKFSGNQLELKESTLRNSQIAYKIFQGNKVLYSFNSKDMGEEVLAFMQNNPFDNFTKIGRGKMGTQFLFRGTSVPDLSTAADTWQEAHVTCQTFNPRMVKLGFVRGTYFLYIGKTKIPFKTEQEMNTAKYLIEKHKLKTRCVVTLGSDRFEYWY